MVDLGAIEGYNAGDHPVLSSFSLNRATVTCTAVQASAA